MTPDDTAMLRVLAGVTFAPEATLTLPSGVRLTAAEANTFTAFYVPNGGPPDRRLPDHLTRAAFTGTISDVADWLSAIDRQAAVIRRLGGELQESRTEARQMWIVACLFAVMAVFAVGLLVCYLLADAA